MRQSLRHKAIAVCDAKIAKKGEGVGLSFYAFFANKNDDPVLLMEAAEWWGGCCRPNLLFDLRGTV